MITGCFHEVIQSLNGVLLVLLTDDKWPILWPKGGALEETLERADADTYEVRCNAFWD